MKCCIYDTYPAVDLGAPLGGSRREIRQVNKARTFYQILPFAVSLIEDLSLVFAFLSPWVVKILKGHHQVSKSVYLAITELGWFSC